MAVPSSAQILQAWTSIDSGEPEDGYSSSAAMSFMAIALLGLDQSLGATAFPASPADGDVLFRTDLGEWFSYDLTNTAWLGQSRHLVFGKGGTGHNNTYLRSGDSIGDPTRGPYLPWDVAVTGMTGRWDTSVTSGDFRVRRDGTNVLGKSILGSSTSFEHLDQYAEFDADGSMEVYLDTLSAGIAHPNVVVFFRRRFDT